jgi:SAM-dependent methyltransferase
MDSNPLRNPPTPLQKEIELSPARILQPPPMTAPQQSSDRLAILQNQSAWDRRARSGDRYVDTAQEPDFKDPLKVADPYSWLDRCVTDKRILCLAAGGGRHGVLFASAGAQVTVVDLSPEMLSIDSQLASARKLNLNTIETSMDCLEMLDANYFDCVFHPVSTCYLPTLPRLFSEVTRVLKDSGLYLSFHKQPASLQTADGYSRDSQGYLLRTPYKSKKPLPTSTPNALHREAGTVEYLHTWESILRGICSHGLVIEDFVEPNHEKVEAQPGSLGHRSQFAPPFFGVKARKQGSSSKEKTPSIIIP